MRTEIMKLIAAVSSLGLLASCAQTDFLAQRSDNTSAAAQNPRTSGYHNSIARRYENAAKELLVKAEERKKLLQHYEDKSHLYGRNGQDFQAKAVAMARKYNLAAEKAAAHAAFHRRMSEPTEPDYIAAGEPVHQVSNR